MRLFRNFYTFLVLLAGSGVVFTGCLDKEGPATGTASSGGSKATTFTGASSATNLDGTRITVSWTKDTSSNVASYKVYTVSGTTTLTPVATTSATASTATVGGLTPCTIYTFVVRAFYKDGTDDGNFTSVSALTFAGVTSISANSSTSITASFATCTAASSFNLYCTNSAGTKTLVGSGTNSSSVTGTGLTAYKYYACGVQAVFLSGAEDANTATLDTPTCYKRPSSIVSIWDADNVSGTTVTDLVGSNTGTMTASTATTTSGKVGSAFSMSAANGGVSVASASSLNPTTGLSASAWVYPSSATPGATQTVVHKGDEASSMVVGDFTYYDMSNVDGTGNNKGFSGAIFDGRYIYYTPFFNGTSDSGKVLRYDTRASLSNSLSYDVFDLATVNASALGYFGGTFDGRYVYFVPNRKPSTNAGTSILARYDTQSTFTSSSSWTLYDLTTINAAYTGFGSASYDGSRYIYFGAAYKTAPTGNFLKYDTQGSGFTNSASYSVVTPFATVPFMRTGFDGRYLYAGAQNGYSPLIYRYDTHNPWLSTNWSNTNVANGANNICGMTFDGRYMYFGSYVGNSIYRYDTTASFTAAGSWSAFDTSGILAAQSQFWGMQFDGRYVYAQAYTGGTLFRYDTTGTFTANGSWTYATFKNIDGNNGINGHDALVFDGRYLYGVPLTSTFYGYNGYVYRYDTGSATNSFRLNSFTLSSDGGSTSYFGPSVSIQTSTGFYQIFGSSLLSAAWNHLAGTWDGSTLKLYVNGSLANSLTATGTLSTNTNSLNIGDYAGGTDSFNGYVDEVAVGNSALSSTDITNLYSGYATYGFCKN